jgi:predicted transcriptional regulator
MIEKKVKDLMIPLSEYAVVPENAGLVEAIQALDEAQKRLQPGRQPHRAILVVDKNNKVIGKIGHLALIKALEPKYADLGDIGKLGMVGLSENFVTSMMQHFSFFHDNLTDICRRASSIKAKEAMRPLTESVDENATLGEAVHKIVMWQSLSILVTRQAEAVGLLRLSDVFDEITEEIKRLASS